jgi:hypothetical protein
MDFTNYLKYIPLAPLEGGFSRPVLLMLNGICFILLYTNASNKISTGCFAVFPVPSLI